MGSAPQSVWRSVVWQAVRFNWTVPVPVPVPVPGWCVASVRAEAASVGASAAVDALMKDCTLPLRDVATAVRTALHAWRCVTDTTHGGNRHCAARGRELARCSFSVVAVGWWPVAVQVHAAAAHSQSASLRRLLELGVSLAAEAPKKAGDMTACTACACLHYLPDNARAV